MRVISCCLFFFSITITLPVGAQVVEAERGQVEFVGLKSWTVPNLVDTLRVLDPDRPLHACAAILKQKLGFSDASVKSYAGANGMYTVVTVIEPQDSARVRYRHAPIRAANDVGEWKEAVTLFEEEYGTFHLGLQFYGHFLTGNPDSARAELADLSDLGGYVDSEKAEEFWEFLQRHNQATDKELALWTLTNDGNESHRVIAVALLANFPDVDLVWWRLADALRDPSNSVRTMAQAVLSTLGQHVPKQIDWEPALHSLTWILGGTNLFAFTETLDLLLRTNVSPDLARELLKNNAELLLAYVNAEHANTRQLAHAFLAHLSGQNYDSVQLWEQWLKQIGAI